MEEMQPGKKKLNSASSENGAVAKTANPIYIHAVN
jgi:hypothetical protein